MQHEYRQLWREEVAAHGGLFDPITATKDRMLTRKCWRPLLAGSPSTFQMP